MTVRHTVPRGRVGFGAAHRPIVGGSPGDGEGHHQRDEDCRRRTATDGDRPASARNALPPIRVRVLCVQSTTRQANSPRIQAAQPATHGAPARAAEASEPAPGDRKECAPVPPRIPRLGVEGPQHAECGGTGHRPTRDHTSNGHRPSHAAATTTSTSPIAGPMAPTDRGDRLTAELDEARRRWPWRPARSSPAADREPCHPQAMKAKATAVVASTSGYRGEMGSMTRVASPPERQPRDQRDVLPPDQLTVARRTEGTRDRHRQSEWRPVDDDVEEGADEESDDAGQSHHQPTPWHPVRPPDTPRATGSTPEPALVHERPGDQGVRTAVCRAGTRMVAPRPFASWSRSP